MSDNEEENNSQVQGSETEKDEQDDDQAEEEDLYINNHDLIGVDGIIRAQKNEIEKKKVGVIDANTLQLELRIENEKYFRAHPELNAMVQMFIYKVLDDRPDNILAYAGSFFDRAELHEVVKKSSEDNKEQEKRIKYLNDLIKGKTLIE